MCAGTTLAATERVLREQAEYYRERAPEYDQWWLREGRYDRGLTGQWRAEAGAVAEALHAFEPRGRVLELACGTGIWSERLLRFATDLTALDASPEMLALNAARLGSPANVDYVEADLFRWEPTGGFDVVFFGFWLSHVPPERFEGFWDLVRRCLAPAGRVFFVDSRREEASTAADHRLPPAPSHVVQRRLNNGREFEIVKIFYEPRPLAERLSGLGWRFNIRDTERYFIYGHGTPQE